MSQEVSVKEIGAMKDQWRQEFRETRSEITRLHNKLGELHRKLCAADEILATAARKNQLHATQDGNGRYANLGVTEALRLFFTQHAFTQHSISALAYRLELEGLKSGASDLRATIAMTCRRLEEKEQFLESILEGGVRLFRLAKERRAESAKPTPPAKVLSHKT